MLLFFPVGATITITGTSFGAASAPATVKVNNINCPVTSQSHTQLVCSLQPYLSGPAFSLPVVVTQGSQSSSAFVGVSFTVPTLDAAGTTIQGVGGPAANLVFASLASHTVTLAGKNFGSTPGFVTVVFGEPATPARYTCAVQSVTNTQIVCTTPTLGVGGDLHFTVTVSNGAVTQTSPVGTDSVSYPRPALVPNTIRLPGKTSVTPLIGTALPFAARERYKSRREYPRMFVSAHAHERTHAHKPPSFFLYVQCAGTVSQGQYIQMDCQWIGTDASKLTVRYGLPGSASPKPYVCGTVSLPGGNTLQCATAPATGTIGDKYVFEVTVLNQLSDEGTDKYQVRPGTAHIHPAARR